MSEKLDYYRPSLDAQQGVRRQLIKAGVPHELIDSQWLEAIIAATFKWVKTTSEGAEHVANIMEFDWCHGHEDKAYRFIDDDNNKVREIAADDVLFVRGVFVRGHAIPLSQLEVSEKEREECESCGIMSHCTKLVRDPGRDSMERLCNYCIVNHEHPRVNDEGDIDVCVECPKLDCPSKTHGTRLAFG